jgi:hypothetical protein
LLLFWSSLQNNCFVDVELSCQHLLYKLAQFSL